MKKGIIGIFFALGCIAVACGQNRIIPPADGDGGIGRDDRYWGESFIDELNLRVPLAVESGGTGLSRALTLEDIEDTSLLVRMTADERGKLAAIESGSSYLKKNSYPTGYQTHKGEFIIDSEFNKKILTLDRPLNGNLHTVWAIDLNGIIDVIAQDYSPANSETLLSFKDIFTSSPYTEFVQPVKAPTPTAADDSTNVATTEWVKDLVDTKADLTDPVFTGVVTAPTVFIDLGNNHFKITNPVGGSVFGSTELVPGSNISLYLPEVPNGNSYKCSIKLTIDGLSTVNIDGYTYNNLFTGARVSGSIAQDFSDKVLKIRAGYAPATTGYYRPMFVLGDETDSMYNLWSETCSVVVEEFTFSTTDDIVDELTTDFVVEIRNSLIPDSGIFYTKYLYPPVTAHSKSKITSGILVEETPASSSATGTKGMIRYDANYVYVCVATDTWIRLEKTTW